MHLLSHLFIPLLLFLRGSAVLDSLNVRLQVTHQHRSTKTAQAKMQVISISSLPVSLPPFLPLIPSRVP